MFFKEGRTAFLEVLRPFDTRSPPSRFQLVLINFAGDFPDHLWVKDKGAECTSSISAPIIM